MAVEDIDNILQMIGMVYGAHLKLKTKLHYLCCRFWTNAVSNFIHVLFGTHIFHHRDDSLLHHSNFDWVRVFVSKR